MKPHNKLHFSKLGSQEPLNRISSLPAVVKKNECARALYYKLARREEADMEKEFGDKYLQYKKMTAMFIPLPRFSN